MNAVSMLGYDTLLTKEAVNTTARPTSKSRSLIRCNGNQKSECQVSAKERNGERYNKTNIRNTNITAKSD